MSRLLLNDCLHLDNHLSIAKFLSALDTCLYLFPTMSRIIWEIGVRILLSRILTFQSQILIRLLLAGLALPLPNRISDPAIRDSKKRPFPGLTAYMLIFLHFCINPRRKIDSRGNFMVFEHILKTVYILSRLVSLPLT